MEIRRSTTTERRLLGKLLIAFTEEDASLTEEDMFLRVLSDEYELMTRKRYIELRNAICSRLTIFNSARKFKTRKMHWKVGGLTSHESKC